MDKFLSVFRAYSPESPLRPLLLATGAAAAAAGIYYLVKWTDGNKTTENPEDTSDPGDPVCNGATEPALVRATEGVQDQMKVSLANAEEQHQKDTITQLKQENSDLTDQECEREQEAHKLLKVQYREMMETNSETVLKASVAEADKKHQKAVEKHQKAAEKHQKSVETITQLEQEKINLRDQVKTLRNTMQDMGNQLCDIQLQCDELKNECEREQEAHNLLKVQYREMMETNSETVLKASVAEADKKHQKAEEKHQKAEEKHQKSVETITQLEQEKINLTDQVKSLRETMKDMWNQLCDTHLQCDELKNECEKEQEAHSLLQLHFHEMMETLTNSETVLKDSLAEAEKRHKKAEEKHQKSVETITQLEQEKHNLTDQVKSLRDTVEDMGNQLYDIQLQCDELKNEWEQEQEANRLLKVKYEEMTETLTDSEKVLKEHHQQLKGHSTLKMEKDELKQSLTLSQHLLKESLNQAEEKHNNAVLSTDELEAEMSGLKTHVDPVRLTRRDKIKRMFLKIVICKSDKCLGTKDTESSLSQSGSSSESV